MIPISHMIQSETDFYKILDDVDDYKYFQGVT